MTIPVPRFDGGTRDLTRVVSELANILEGRNEVHLLRLVK